MVKLSKNKIEFCGKERKFKRCPNKVLRDSNKEVEALQKEAADKREEVNKKIVESTTKRNEAGKLYSLPYKDDDTLKKNQTKADKLIKEAEKIEAGIEDMVSDIDEWMADHDERMIKAYDAVCLALLDPMEPGEFIDNYDSVDFIIAKNLGLFYDLYMTNTPQAKIDLRLRQLVDAEHENRLAQFRQEE